MKRVFPLLAFFCSLSFACNNEKKDSVKVTSDTTQQGIDTANIGPDTSYTALIGHAQAILAETHTDTVVTGTATFDTIPGGKVKMVLEITVPSKAGKSIAVHIHEHGDCSDKGNMAHGHWNPTSHIHGKWGSSAFHAGDIGNIKLDSKGKGTMNLETDLWTLGGNHRTNILKRAIIVHGGTDDFTTQPTGNAGSRIGCGIIQ